MGKILKSDRTRTRILQAAAQLFAERGYERTTIREISSLAQIDPAMVMRYFGNKESLFSKAAHFDLRLPDLRALEKNHVGAALVGHFLEIWEDEAIDNGFLILLRAAASNEGAAATLREILVKQVLPAVKRIAPGNLASARAGLIATQMLGLALGRYVLKLPPVVGLSRIEVVRFIGPTIQNYVLGKLGTDGA
jgi:AcrR family transcriptional regulator